MAANPELTISAWEIGEATSAYGNVRFIVDPVSVASESRFDESNLDDLLDAMKVEAAYQEYLRDPSIGQPYEEFLAEMINEGLLDE